MIQLNYNWISIYNIIEGGVTMAQTDIIRAIMDSDFRVNFLKEHNISEEDLLEKMSEIRQSTCPSLTVI